MEKLYEILFLNGNLESKQWELLITKISKYLGSFHKWKLYLYIIGEEIHFYLLLKYSLPCQLTGLDFFCFQERDFTFSVKYFKKSSFVFGNLDTLLEIYDKWSNCYQRKIRLLEVVFFTGTEEKNWHFNYLYYEKNGKLYQKKVLILSLSSFLACDFIKMNRFVYQKIPKYLNVQKYLPLFQDSVENALLEISTFPYCIQKKYLSIHQYDFDKHSFVLGSSGTGKSKFLSSFIYQILQDTEFQKKYKVVMIDPHAAMEKDIGGLSNTKVIDFEEESIDLFSSSFENVISKTEMYLSLFSMLMQESYNSKLERVLRFSFQLLLSIQQFTFQNLRSLLTNVNYRNELLSQFKANILERTYEFFMQDFYELKTKFYGEAIAPILSFLDEIQSIPIFQNEVSATSFEEVIHENFLTLFSINRAFVGDRITKIISGFLMCQLFELVGSYSFCEHVILIIDEVAVIENPVLCRFLSEARKYHLSVILVSQYFNQISSDLKDAILANVVNYYVFRISFWDAQLLVNQLNINLSSNNLEDKIKLLMNLSHREGIVRISKNGKMLPAFFVKTLDFTSIPRERKSSKKEKREEKKALSKKQFCLSSSISLHQFLTHMSTSHRKVRD